MSPQSRILGEAGTCVRKAAAELKEDKKKKVDCCPNFYLFPFLITNHHHVTLPLLRRFRNAFDSGHASFVDREELGVNFDPELVNVRDPPVFETSHGPGSPYTSLPVTLRTIQHKEMLPSTIRVFFQKQQHRNSPWG